MLRSRSMNRPTRWRRLGDSKAHSFTTQHFAVRNAQRLQSTHCVHPPNVGMHLLEGIKEHICCGP